MQVLRAQLPRAFCLTLLAIGATSFVPAKADEQRVVEEEEAAEAAEAEVDQAAAEEGGEGEWRRREEEGEGQALCAFGGPGVAVYDAGAGSVGGRGSGGGWSGIGGGSGGGSPGAAVSPRAAAAATAAAAAAGTHRDFRATYGGGGGGGSGGAGAGRGLISKWEERQQLEGHVEAAPPPRCDSGGGSGAGSGGSIRQYLTDAPTADAVASPAARATAAASTTSPQGRLMAPAGAHGGGLRRYLVSAREPAAKRVRHGAPSDAPLLNGGSGGQDAQSGAAAWACLQCTFLHDGPAAWEYLACSMCGQARCPASA